MSVIKIEAGPNWRLAIRYAGETDIVRIQSPILLHCPGSYEMRLHDDIGRRAGVTIAEFSLDREDFVTRVRAYGHDLSEAKSSAGPQSLPPDRFVPEASLFELTDQGDYLEYKDPNDPDYLKMTTFYLKSIPTPQ